MKFCNECVHKSDYMCQRPIGVNPVTSGVVTRDHTCTYERSVPVLVSYMIGSCGKHGRFHMKRKQGNE